MITYLSESRFRNEYSIIRESAADDHEDELFFTGMQVVKSDIESIDFTNLTKTEMPHQSVSWVDISPGNIVYLSSTEKLYWITDIYGPYKAIGVTAVRLEDEQKVVIDTMKDFEKIHKLGDHSEIYSEDHPYAFPLSDRFIATQINCEHKLVAEHL
jgi:hypothetical protein